MKTELQEKLYDDYPLTFVDKDNKKSCMSRGIECRDGWFDLINRLCAEIEPLIDKFVEENPDCERLPRAAQVKQKFGGLRFYIVGDWQNHRDFMEKLWEISHRYETESYTLCEKCGEEGKKGGCGYIQTLCENHWNSDDEEGGFSAYEVMFEKEKEDG
jgi:hypothetical protein